MNRPIDFDLIDRHLAGEATERESAALLARAQRDPALADLLRQLAQPSPAQPAWDTSGAWAKVRRSTQRTRNVLRWASAAAAVVIIGVGVVFSQRGPRAENAIASAAVRTYTTDAGEREVVALPDGSVVTLAPRSEMTVPVLFSGDERIVRLNGEAFFDVKPDSTRPFMVAAQGTITRVLGTSFSVSAYAGQPAVEVLVVTGRVLVRPERSTEGTTLAPGERARTDSTRVIAVDTVADPVDYTGWREGRLVFRNVALADALPRLERWYGIDVRVPDRTLAATRFTAYLDQQQLDDVLNVLAATLNARIERADTVITFYPRQ